MKHQKAHEISIVVEYGYVETSYDPSYQSLVQEIMGQMAQVSGSSEVREREAVDAADVPP